MENFLPLRRELKEHWVYSDSQYLHLWLEILFNARYSTESKTEVHKGVMYTLNRGEFLFSRPSYAKRLGMTDNRVRKCIDLMLKDNMIVKVGSLGRNKPTIYKVTNYDEYNSSPTETVGVEETEGFSTNSKPTENQLKTNSPPLKKIEKKEKIEKKDINNKRSKLKFETIHLKLAELLFKKIKENNPNAKKPNLESWANTFRLMIESDKRDGKEIQDIILWCQSHHFWYQNILSADKLRKQYDRLKLQMLDDGGQKNERNQSSYEQDYSKYDFYKSGEL